MRDMATRAARSSSRIVLRACAAMISWPRNSPFQIIGAKMVEPIRDVFRYCRNPPCSSVFLRMSLAFVE